MLGHVLHVCFMRGGEMRMQVQGLSVELLQQAMEAHMEAAERCKVLYAGELQAEHICLLFCSRSIDFADLPGCLLQQVACSLCWRQLWFSCCCLQPVAGFCNCLIVAALILTTWPCLPSQALVCSAWLGYVSLESCVAV